MWLYTVAEQQHRCPHINIESEIIMEISVSYYDPSNPEVTVRYSLTEADLLTQLAQMLNTTVGHGVDLEDGIRGMTLFVTAETLAQIAAAHLRHIFPSSDPEPDAICPPHPGKTLDAGRGVYVCIACRAELAE